jgi:hypothetical protein
LTAAGRSLTGEFFDFFSRSVKIQMSAAVLERIQGHCRYFDSMVSLIPAKIYLGKNYDGVAMVRRPQPQCDLMYRTPSINSTRRTQWPFSSLNRAKRRHAKKRYIERCILDGTDGA